MQRFNSWEQTVTPDFWRERFKPKDILRVMAHINSILSMRTDAKLMERYDINDVDEHSVGMTLIWVPVTFGEPTYLGDDKDFPWQYDIDENWLYVDAIYEKHVDPEVPLQHDIDFVLSKGHISFVDKLPEQTLYISKGRYAAYRIYNEIGMLLDYKRLDSVSYRDSIAPILAAFYLGPTYNNLLAVLNLIVGLPVAKYGNETVLSINGGVVETDKYTYPMGNANISVKEGDVLYQFQPLSNAVELVTHETHPYWWESRPVDLFAKYCIDQPMTSELRDYLMRNFLYDVVAYVRLNMQWQDLEVFSQNADIRQLFYDALPTRTDIFMGQQYVAESYDLDDTIISPDTDSLGVRLGSGSMYGLKDIDSDMFIYAPDLGRPIFTDTATDPLALVLNQGYWHIFSESETNNWREFWKSKPNQQSYFEPAVSKVYLRLSETAPWDHMEEHVLTSGVPAELSDMGVRINLSGEGEGGISSTIEFDMEETAPTYTAVQGETICGVLEMDTWELNNLTIARNGLEVLDGDSGYAVTTAFPLGGIPKNVFIRTEYDTPESTLVDVRYSMDKDEWLPIPEIIPAVTGNIYFKITLYASAQKSPTFRRLYVNLSMI